MTDGTTRPAEACHVRTHCCSVQGVVVSKGENLPIVSKYTSSRKYTSWFSCNADADISTKHMGDHVVSISHLHLVQVVIASQAEEEQVAVKETYSSDFVVVFGPLNDSSSINCRVTAKHMVEHVVSITHLCRVSLPVRKKMSQLQWKKPTAATMSWCLTPWTVPPTLMLASAQGRSLECTLPVRSAKLTTWRTPTR